MSAPNLHPRDPAVLRHIALYRKTIYPALSPVFFDGKGVGHIIDKLARSGLIEVQRRAIDKYNLVSLRPEGARIVGCPKDRCQVQAAALNQALGIVVYCCVGKTRRHRLEPSDLQKALGSGSSSSSLPGANVAHILSEEPGYPAIFRVYQCQTGASEGIAQMRAHFEASVSNPALKKWVLSRDYGFLCLGTTKDKVIALRAAAKREGIDRDALVQFGLGPDQSTLSQTLKQWREGI